MLSPKGTHDQRFRARLSDCSSFRHLLESAKNLGRTTEVPTEEAVKKPELLKAALKGHTATGGQRICANILLTIRVVPPAK
jgi:hypothetical protein